MIVLEILVVVLLGVLVVRSFKKRETILKG